MHRQAVAAVELELAQRLGEGLGGEQRLGVVLSGIGPGSGVRAGPGGPGDPAAMGSGAAKGRMASAAVRSSNGPAEAGRSMSMPRRSSLVV